MTALIAVAAALGPQLKAMFASPSSRISAVMIGTAANDRVLMLVSNEGGRQGVILGGALSIPIAHFEGTSNAEGALTVRSEDGALFIAPHSTSKLTLDWKETRYLLPSMALVRVPRQLEINALGRMAQVGVEVCRVELDIVNADGAASKIENSFPCQKIAMEARRRADLELHAQPP
ncbi:hypothetical protein QTH97_35435 [Variovorax sp. J22R24]|uniref:hypothetical protein n=1 Tax=Variovorax gracilis TaxID=3053502 RepID=UPI0025756B9B|nr:hypothetical protein [Variovorax sp. J22R24]MDM0110230.1 hypothetical protein [Variovorax sp. J22R24]